jgi:phosphatidylglycerophosphate synthase
MKLLSLQELHILKDRFFKLFFYPIAKRLNSFGIMPNYITVLSVFIALLGITFMFQSLPFFFVCFLLHLILDLFDGYYARAFDLQSVKGEYLDHGGDMITIFYSLVLAYIYYDNILIVFLLIFYCIELIVLVQTNLIRNKFPSRLFLYFAMFGLLPIGIIIQAIYEPISLLIVTILTFRKEKY